MGHERRKLLNGLDPNAFRPSTWHLPSDKTPQRPDDVEVASRGKFQPKIGDLGGLRFLGIHHDHFSVEATIG